MIDIKLTSTNFQKITQFFDRNRTVKSQQQTRHSKNQYVWKGKPTQSKTRKYLEFNNDENSVISKPMQ